MGNFINVKTELPKDGSAVEVITNSGDILRVRFESFLGNQIWEYDSLEEDCEILGWRYYD
jgi:hypothetical protein